MIPSYKYNNQIKNFLRMKLIRFGKSGEEKPGVAIDDNLYDASEFGEDYNEKFFETAGLSRLEKFLKGKKVPFPKLEAT